MCGKQNVQGRFRPRPGKMPNAQYPFHTICMDFIELNKCENKKYCLVIIDLYSKWIEVIPTTRNDAITVAKASQRLCSDVVSVDVVSVTSPQTV